MSDYCIDVENDGSFVIELSRVGGQGAACTGCEDNEVTTETTLFQTGGWGFGQTTDCRWHIGAQGDAGLYFVSGLNRAAVLDQVGFYIAGDLDVDSNISIIPESGVTGWKVWEDTDNCTLVWQYNGVVIMTLDKLGNLKLSTTLESNQAIVENGDSWFLKFGNDLHFELTQSGDLKLRGDLHTTETL